MALITARGFSRGKDLDAVLEGFVALANKYPSL